MKFILVISLCSFVNNECLPPVQVTTQYESWKECTIAALTISKEIIKKQKDKDVNIAKLATKFMCEEIKET
jgi:post-segregation antitoxin (ccd killing protein)